jgi:hypothetical protein
MNSVVDAPKSRGKSKKMFVNNEQIPGLFSGSSQAGGKAKRKTRKSRKKQAGGIPIPALVAGAAAAHKALETYKPFSRLNNVLRDNVSNKNNILYKIADKITGVGKSLGYGPKKKRA